MNKKLWLIKFALFRTSWEEIVRRGIFILRGVKSPQSRNNLAAMSLGDPVLFYQSQKEQAVVGLMDVIRESYPDPTSADSSWLTCDFRPLETFPHFVTLSEIKSNPLLREISLIRQPRLAVMPLIPDHFKIILNMAGISISNS